MTRKLILFAVALLLTGCSFLPSEAEEVSIEVAEPVLTQREVIEAKVGTVESRLTQSATFGAERQAPLYFRSRGRVRKIHVAFGQPVVAGQLLAELESGSLKYDLTLAELEVERARALLERAGSEVDRIRYEFDLRQAETRLQRQKELMADTVICAPSAGQAVNLAVAEGDQVEAYQEVLSVAAQGRTVARISVDEATAARLEPGMKAEIFVNGDPAPLAGHVLSVPPVGSGPRVMAVVIAPDEASQRLVPGRNGTVEIILQAKSDALLVPVSSVRAFGGRKFVTVVKGETRQEVTVRTGIEGDEFVEITEGLQAGDRVISR